MLMSVARPRRVDVLPPDDDDFDQGTAAGLLSWHFDLSQSINAARILQQRVHQMPFSHIQMKAVGWAESGLKQEEQENQETASYGRPYNTQVLAATMMSNCTSRTSPLSHVSHFSTTTGPRDVCQSSSASVPVSPELLESPYWQGITATGPDSLPFVAPGGEAVWGHAPSILNPPPAFNYGSYTIGVHASMIPQQVFSGIPSVPDSDTTDHGSPDSKLCASSDLLGPIVLDDESSQAWSMSPSETSPALVEGQPGVDVAWDDSATDDKTVSPKMLRLRRSPTPCSVYPEPALLPPAAKVDIALESPKNTLATSKTRKLLQSKSQRTVLPSGSTVLSSSSSKTKGRPSNTRSPSPSLSRKTISKPKSMPRLAPAPRMPPSPTTVAALDPSLPSLRCTSQPFGSEPWSEVPQIKFELSDRMSKDQFLVTKKREGLTYKEIRRMGGFTEAESTLRGRYRTLTKSREARVRKPEWSELDLRLLEKGVRALAHTPDLNSAKVPWKKVAEYIVEHGGSYHFGNSTCRKRWDELVREQMAKGKSINEPFFDDEPARCPADGTTGQKA